MPRALITGVSGFVGPFLAAYLRDQGIECAGISSTRVDLDHPVPTGRIRTHELDIRDKGALDEVLLAEKPDYVFHLAAISHIPTAQMNPEVTFGVNVVGTFNLFESLRRCRPSARTVFVSTGNLYGGVDSGEGGFTEESPVRATSQYACSKLIGEQLARSYAEDFGLAIIVARPFNHTGPGQTPLFACPAFAKTIAEGRHKGTEIRLQTGRLDPQRDICDVRDVVRAYALLAEFGMAGEVYNVCSGSTVSMAEVLSMIANLANVRAIPEVDPSKFRANEVMRSGGNCDKIRRHVGWTPKIPLSETLRNLLDYWTVRTQNANSC